jgi:hypothetical protein
VEENKAEEEDGSNKKLVTTKYQNMKKTITTAVFLLLIYGFVFAQSNRGQGQRQAVNKECPAYVNASDKGICDNSNGNNCRRYGRQKKSNMRSTGNGRWGAGNGQGMRHGAARGNGFGQGINYMDANKNGVCDSYEKQHK